MIKSLLATLDFSVEKKHTYVLLLSAPVLLSLYYYHGAPSKFLEYFPSFINAENAELYGHYWQFLCLFVLAGLVPSLYLRGGMKVPLAQFGLGLGDWKAGLQLVLVLLPMVVVPLIWVAAGRSDIQGEYPMLRSLYHKPQLFWRYEIAYVLLYYVAWEFFFRGFLLFGLARDIGATNAILIQTISSCLIHLNKPESETLASIATGIILGIIALRTRSIWYAFVLHASVGVLTDFFVLIRTGGVF